MADSWFTSATPVLSQLGATIGWGVTSPAQNASSGGMSAEERDFYTRISDEQARQADRAYKQKKQELDRNYQLAKQSAKTAQQRLEIDRWHVEQDIKLAQERLAQEAKISEARLAEDSRQFNERLGFDRESFDKTFGLNQAKLGYDLLGMQANLRGPDDYFAASNLARGVAAQPGSATFLDALRNNTHLAGFGAQAGAPDAATVNSLAAKMGGGPIMPGTGGGGGGQTGVDALHSQIQQLGLQGAHKLGAGSLEQLTPTELALLKGGLETAGPDGKAFDWDTFLTQYRNSRIGQGYSSPRAV